LRFIGLIVAMLLAVLALAAGDKFTPAELFIIQWGEAPDELKICPVAYEDVDGTPEDSTDDMLFPCGGPTYGFVDHKENIYFSSYEFGQFKAFDNFGNLFLDLSRGTSAYNEEIFASCAFKFAVDSKGFIYFVSFPELRYVPVVDKAGVIVNKLYPCGESDPVEVDNIYFNYDDVMAFSCGHRGYRTYLDSHFIPSGSAYWGRDGNYYTARQMDSSIVEFKKYGNPDSTGWGQWREVINVDMGEEIYMRDFFGVDDNMLLYIIFDDTHNNTKIRSYTTEYILRDELVWPHYENRFEWEMAPFLRSDGNVYEFRCLDDGLHVIRWSKQ